MKVLLDLLQEQNHRNRFRPCLRSLCMDRDFRFIRGEGRSAVTWRSTPTQNPPPSQNLGLPNRFILQSEFPWMEVRTADFKLSIAGPF